MWVGQDSIGVWFELCAWIFWGIAFELDQGCDHFPVLGSWATMILSVSTLVATSSVKGIGRGVVLAFLCLIRVERNIDLIPARRMR